MRQRYSRHEEERAITKSSKNANAAILASNTFSLARMLEPALGESSDHCNIPIQLLLRSIELRDETAIRRRYSVDALELFARALKKIFVKKPKYSV